MIISKSVITWTSVAFGIICIIGVLVLVNLTGSKISQNYFANTPEPVQINTPERNSQTFTIRKISLQTEGSCQTLEITRNGEAKQIDCDDNYLQNRLVLTNEQIAKLFQKLSKADFNNLSTKYYLPGLERDIVIKIETNFGTKEITITSKDPTAPTAPPDFQDIIEETEDIEEEINNPPPSPTPTPTILPSPGVSPTPLASGAPSPSPIIEPSPSPDPAATPEPFRCDMLDQQGVTVSNIRCLEE